MTFTRNAFALLLISITFTILAPAARAVPGEAAKPQPASPPTKAAGVAQDRLLAEKARLQRMEQAAFTANPDLKRVEGAYYALRTKLRQKQEEVRKAIDDYLKKEGLTKTDLERFKLGEITALMMKILPAEVVEYPELKSITVTAIRQGQPVFPAEFEKQFPGKRPTQVPAEELLNFYKTQLKAEAARSGWQLSDLLKESKTPEFMVQSMQMLTRMRCVQIVYREYLRVATPAELNRQRALVRQLEQQGQAGGKGVQVPRAEND